jgi:putative membrane protein
MRPAPLIAGCAALAFAWLGPLPEISAFAAHMTLHMTVVAVAAPLIALGIAGSRFDPVRKAPVIFAPIPASIVELMVVWAWHAPDLHHAARHTMGAFLAEQGMFLGAGLLVWLSALGGDARSAASRTGAGIVALLLTSMHMTLLGALLALTPRPLYVHTDSFASLSALGDQQLGGAIMILAGAASYLLGGLWLTVGLLRERQVEEGIGA